MRKQQILLYSNPLSDYATVSPWSYTHSTKDLHVTSLHFSSLPIFHFLPLLDVLPSRFKSTSLHFTSSCEEEQECVQNIIRKKKTNRYWRFERKWEDNIDMNETLGWFHLTREITDDYIFGTVIKFLVSSNSGIFKYLQPSALEDGLYSVRLQKSLCRPYLHNLDVKRQSESLVRWADIKILESGHS